MGSTSSLAELLKAFPQEVRGSGLFIPEQDAKEIYARQGIYRHFLGDGEVLEFQDLSRYAISNQWGKGNIERFIEQSQKNGYEVEETS